MPSVRSIFSVAAQTARLMVGVPDYETYVDHRRAYHPGKAIMTTKNFSGNARTLATRWAKANFADAVEGGSER